MGSGFRHEALIYADEDEFLGRAVPFVSTAVEAGEPVLIAVSDRNVGLLGRELGSAAAQVRFAAIEELARNPARVVPFWRDFLDEHDGGPVRGLEEPVWPGRTQLEVDECERSELLLNIAFTAEVPLSLLCAYDGATLPAEVLNGVSRCHHVTFDGGGVRSTDGHRPVSDQYAGRLPAPPAEAASFEFDRDDLSEVRRRIESAAAAAGLGKRASSDLVLAASELAANSIIHGGGTGILRCWREAGRLVVDFEDAGWISEPLAGRLRPSVMQEGGRGLWLANQLCDLVQIRSSAAGTTVRLQVALD
ncbi:MAG TPA: sensor histidine kinase [Solirubrobacterales bacterium]|nr:sensor histidine kinase [Solirubrobacterales bacterium]